MDINRRGQALLELAVGMLALSLVVTALCVFAVYIAKSLRAQNELRTEGTRSAAKEDSVEVGDFAVKYGLFGDQTTLQISEKIVMPDRTILR